MFYLIWRVIDLYEGLIVVDAILSWVPASPGSFLYQAKSAIGSLVDPFLDVFRNAIPALGSSGVSIDFSPVVAIIVLDLIKRLL